MESATPRDIALQKLRDLQVPHEDEERQYSHGEKREKADDILLDLLDALGYEDVTALYAEVLLL